MTRRKPQEGDKVAFNQNVRRGRKKARQGEAAEVKRARYFPFLPMGVDVITEDGKEFRDVPAKKFRWLSKKEQDRKNKRKR